MRCDKDCFHCPFPDCINDSVYPESSYKNRSEEQREYQRAYAKRKRDEARERGDCIICRKKPATYGVKCYECYIHRKRYNRAKCEHKREMWRESGLCWFCGDVCTDGKKVCEKHYETLCGNIRICNESENTKEAQKKFTKWHWNMRKVAEI